MGEHVPERVCVVCRNMSPKPGLIRMVRRPGGRIAWPPEPASGGKGLYVCRSGDCLARMFGEKKLRRMYLESMDEECVERLRAQLPEASLAAGLKEGKA